MSKYLDCSIIPYKGIDSIEFGTKLEDIKIRLKKEQIPFVQTIDSNKGCVPEIPWIYITIENSITLCFVKGILFEIVVENNYKGKLLNGGHIGMQLVDLEGIDNSLKYNDEEEDYYSEKGYWILDDIETGRVLSITVFVPEINDDDFFEYKWIDKYLYR